MCFGGEIYNDRIYGRGATDCNGLLTCQLMALRILKQNNIINQNVGNTDTPVHKPHEGSNKDQFFRPSKLHNLFTNIYSMP